MSLTIHEAAHAWTAEQLGDPTARLLGRVSLNPIVHIDPIGTILLPLLAAYSGLPIIGWAKPVPVNVRRLRRGRRDFMIVAAAGPISNLLQAVVGAIAFMPCMRRAPTAADSSPEFLTRFVQHQPAARVLQPDAGAAARRRQRARRPAAPRAPSRCSTCCASTASSSCTRLMLTGVLNAIIDAADHLRPTQRILLP